MRIFLLLASLICISACNVTGRYRWASRHITPDELVAACCYPSTQSPDTDKQLMRAYFASLGREPLKGIAIEAAVPDRYQQAIGAVAPVVNVSGVSNEAYEIAPGFAIVRKIDVAQDKATIVATFGPMHRNANLDCGTTISLDLFLKSGVWVANETLTLEVC